MECGGMAFGSKSRESVGHKIAGNIRRELRNLLSLLGAKVKPRERDAWEIKVVHEVRKTCKKVRAALRLVRAEIGDDVYHRENLCFRDAARRIGEVRDAQVLSKSLEKLRGQFADQIAPEIFAKIYEALLANQRKVVRHGLRKNSIRSHKRNDHRRAFAAF
jgi:hypothetical protein